MRLVLCAALVMAEMLACGSSERASRDFEPDAPQAPPAPATDAPPRPNIVFILADDLGWKDVGFHGSEIATPHIDRLAASGAKLEAHYTLPLCTPTRAALLTGRHPIRYGLQGDVIKIGDRYGLPLEERTLAQALKEAGYATAITGKWHLGHFEDAYKPTRRGFERQYGFYTGEIDYFAHVQSDGAPDWHRDDAPLEEAGYATELIAREAVRRIQDRDPAKPFFLYVAFNAPHRPLQAPRKAIERNAHIAHGPRRLKAATISSLDDAVGEIVAAIDAQGIARDTLIVFSSDNGGIDGKTRESDNSPLRGGKYLVYEGGVRVAACAAWPGVIEAGRVVSEPVHVVDWFPTLLGLAGAKTSQARPLDGLDVWPVIARCAPTPHDEILINVRDERSALRRGPWKLVVTRAANGETVELFDVVNDPGETANRAAAEPDRVRDLRERLDRYAAAAVPELAPR